MHKLYLLLPGLAMLSAQAFAQTTDSNMDIVLVDANGDSNFDGTDYPDKITMTENSDGSFTATAVQVDYGFYFLGYSTTAATGTLYSLSTWAQNPPVQIGPNPLSITTSSLRNYVSVPSGSYDISFIPSSVSSSTTRMFTIVPSAGSIAEPDKIYLAQGSSAASCTELTGTAGEFTAMAGYPAGAFKVSYEPSDSYDAFIYGPADASDATVEYAKTIPLQRNVNTDVAFTIPDEYKGHKVTISLEPGNEYLLLGAEILTGVESIATEAGDEQLTVYNASGMKIGTMDKSAVRQLPANLYLVRHADGTVSRTFVR